MRFSEKWKVSKTDITETMPKNANIQNEAKTEFTNSRAKNANINDRGIFGNIGHETLIPDFSKNHLADLLSEVGATIVHDNGSQVLRFKPLLAGPKVDPGRWANALELEALFFKQSEE
ncbi:hypothetical protein [Desulfonatronovibrio magnus]|uniref:hypothetical protein n=1 Tax=Desulfonatronovibrio magnus TaxID=698827 RepID=UPI0005EB5F29|nr:hypothetical protein [Desulfonatronovibrio magnus]